MAGRKLSSKTEEEVVFMEQLLLQCDTLTRKVEEYATCKTKGADQIVQQIVRQLSQVRQQAMMKNLGPLADAAGTLSILAGRGSQMQRTRTMRDGLVGFKQNIERTMKAAIDADQRTQALAEKEREVQRAAEKAAAARMAQRALREEELARERAAAPAAAPAPVPAPPTPKPEVKP